MLARDEESKRGYPLENDLIASPNCGEYDRGIGFGTAPSSSREADRHLFGPGEALDPDALDADFAKLQQNFDDHD